MNGAAAMFAWLPFIWNCHAAADDRGHEYVLRAVDPRALLKFAGAKRHPWPVTTLTRPSKTCMQQIPVCPYVR